MLGGHSTFLNTFFSLENFFKKVTFNSYFNIANYLFLELPTQVQTPVPKQKERAKPHCKECGHPMKGHAKVNDCPQNKK